MDSSADFKWSLLGARRAHQHRQAEPRRDHLKSAEESMEILAAFDLMGSFHAAADVAGCSHHTVARVVAERDAGGARPRSCRPRLVEEFLPKIEEWVEKSNGKIRSDPGNPIATSLSCATSARILPFDFSTHSSIFGRNSSTNRGRHDRGRAPPASRSATTRATVWWEHPATSAAA